MACFLLSLGGCTIGWIRAGVLRGCASFHRGEFGSCCSMLAQDISPVRMFIRNELLHIEYLRGEFNYSFLYLLFLQTSYVEVGQYIVSWWKGWKTNNLAGDTIEVRKNNFGYSVSMVSRHTTERAVLPNGLSLYPRLDQCAHYASKHILIVEFGLLRTSENSLHTRVHLPLFFNRRVWSQSIGHCQLMMRNLPLVTLEQWFCCFLLSRIRFPEAVRYFRCVKLVRSSVRKVLVPHDGKLLSFDSTDQTKHTLRRKHTTDCLPKWVRTMIVFAWVVHSESEWSACPVLDLRSPFKNGSSTI